MSETETVAKVQFAKNEKVLCYEPDPLKAKILYDSKIMNVHEIKGKDGCFEYTVHFQNWSRTWDCKVTAEFLLKDTEENRQLQRELVGKAQLKKNTTVTTPNKKKRLRKPAQSGILVKSGESGVLKKGNTEPITSAEGGSPRKLIKLDVSEAAKMRQMAASKAASESPPKQDNLKQNIQKPDDRVMFRISERLRKYMEYDHAMIIQYGKQHSLPSRYPILAILENFVKHSAVKLVLEATKNVSSRSRSTQQRANQLERKYDDVMSTVCLLKEAVDGLRIYFDFLIEDGLLYKEEKEHAIAHLNNLTNLTYVPSSALLGMSKYTRDAGRSTTILFDDESFERQLSKYIMNIKSAERLSNMNALKTPIPVYSAQNIPIDMKEYLQEEFKWQILPEGVLTAPSMIFGAPHLARLLVKIPELLNASLMNDLKLQILLKHLDSFTNYLESHTEWFNEENYTRYTKMPITEDSNDQIEQQPTTSPATNETGENETEAVDAPAAPTTQAETEINGDGSL